MFSAYCSTLLSALLATYAFLLLFPPVPLAALLPFLVDDMLESAPEARYFTTFLLPAPSVVLSVGFLGLARYFVVRRALVQPGNVARELQSAVDRFWDRLGGTGKKRGRPGTDLPVDRPVAWHEVTRRTPTSPLQLTKLALTLGLPTAAILWLSLALMGGESAGLVRIATVFSWGLAATIIVTKGASLLGTDRANRTLDVLMTTPISSRELVSQRSAGLRRMVPVLAVPIGIASLMRLYTGLLTASAGRVATYALAVVLSLMIFLPMLYWLGIALGLWMKSRSRAVFVATGILASWAILPLLVQGALGEMGIRWRLPWLAYGSPAAMLTYADRALAPRSGTVPGGHAALIMSFMAFAALTVLLRLFVRWSTPRCLARVEAKQRTKPARRGSRRRAGLLTEDTHD
jgi:hypothetical protein